MKNVSVILTIAAAAVTLVAGCSKQESTTPESEATAPEIPAEVEAMTNAPTPPAQ